MVGDTEFDVLGALAHGIPTIGVSWGYGKVSAMEQAGACAIVHTMEELLNAIERTLGHSRHHITVTLPYSMGGMVETLHNNAQVLATDYTAEGIEVETIVDEILYGRLKQYITKEQ